MAAEIDLWQVLFSSRSFAVIGVSLVLLSGSLLCHRLLESTAAGACWYEKLFAWLFLCYFCSLRGLFLSFVLCLLQQFFFLTAPADVMNILNLPTGTLNSNSHSCTFAAE
jgi:hypothetical protein